jgi:hypothetical protein
MLGRNPFVTIWKNGFLAGRRISWKRILDHSMVSFCILSGGLEMFSFSRTKPFQQRWLLGLFSKYLMNS